MFSVTFTVNLWSHLVQMAGKVTAIVSSCGIYSFLITLNFVKNMVHGGGYAALIYIILYHIKRPAAFAHV